MVVPEGELIEQDRAQQESAGGHGAAGRHAAQAAEDRLELSIEVLDAVGAELMEDAAYLDARVGVRVATPLGGDQDAPVLYALVVQGRVVVVHIPQDDVGLGGSTASKAGACTLSATLAGVAAAASGSQTVSETVIARWSSQP